MRSREVLAGAGGVVVVMFGLMGCPMPADLENVPAGSGPGLMMGANSGASCESACIHRMFAVDPQPCRFCHFADKSPAPPPLGGLDLESPNVTSRLLNVVYKHRDIPATAPMMCDAPELLIDPADPARSWLWRKIDRSVPITCGEHMPQTGVASVEQIACIKTYIECVTGKSITGAP